MTIYQEKRRSKATGEMRPTGRVTVEVEAYKEGKRYRKRRSYATEKQARSMETSLLRELKLELEGAPLGDQPEKMTVGAAHTALAPRLWRGSKDEKNPLQRLGRCCALLGMEKPLLELKDSDLDDMVEDLITVHKISGPTINRHLNALRKFLKACKRKGWVETLPEEWPWQKEHEPRSRWFQDWEVKAFPEKMLEYRNPKLGRAGAAFLTIGLRTMMRRGEILAVDPTQDIYTDVDPETGAETYRLLLQDTKTSSPRTIPIDRDVRDLLFAYAPWDEATTGSRSFEYRLYDLWSWTKEQLGLAKEVELVFHAARHTGATFLVDAGVSLPVIQQLLGHQQITTTQRYAHASDAARTDAMSALQARVSGKGGKRGGV